jgi:hypothetical protein
MPFQSRCVSVQARSLAFPLVGNPPPCFLRCPGAGVYDVDALHYLAAPTSQDAMRNPEEPRSRTTVLLIRGPEKTGASVIGQIGDQRLSIGARRRTPLLSRGAVGCCRTLFPRTGQSSYGRRVPLRRARQMKAARRQTQYRRTAPHACPPPPHYMIDGHRMSVTTMGLIRPKTDNIGNSTDISKREKYRTRFG